MRPIGIPREVPKRRAWVIAGVVLGVLVVAAFLTLFFINEPLRAYLERTANERLQNYEVRIGGLGLNMLAGTIEFTEVSLQQRRRPDPPLARIEKWKAGIHWLDILFGRLVSEHRVVRPMLSIQRPQDRGNAAHAIDRATDLVQEPGWQEAVLALFPITINEFVIEDGDVVYRDHPDKEPLHLSHLNATASNIKNVRTPDRQYPSELSLQTQVFETGRMEMNGHADFLANPYPGFACDIKIEQVPVERLRPFTGRYNVQFSRGTITATGHVEYAPWSQEVTLNDMLAEGMQMDYVHSAPTAKKEKQVAGRVAEKAKAIHRDPELMVKVDHAKILHGEIGFVNKATSPDYRVFITDMNVDLDNFSNRLTEGSSAMKATGRFMGSGPTVVSATFRPEKPDPDFELAVRIVKTNLTTFNGILRAYGDGDVSAGTFAFFSEVKVKDGRIDGYVKPFFKDVEVYEPAQDKDKALIRQAYEALVSGITDLLKNKREQAVATETDVSGKVQNPQANTWQIVEKLVQNAFFKAILPGLEHQLG